MNEYEINIDTLAIIPIDAESCRIIEKNNDFLVNIPAMKIIDMSCKFFGSSYNGRFEGTKNMINISHKAPILIEETKKIIFFPTMSPRIENCTWISLNNIENYVKSGNCTKLFFSCGKELILKVAYGTIDNQILRATRLQYICEERIKKIINN